MTSRRFVRRDSTDPGYSSDDDEEFQHGRKSLSLNLRGGLASENHSSDDESCLGSTGTSDGSLFASSPYSVWGSAGHSITRALSKIFGGPARLVGGWLAPRKNGTQLVRTMACEEPAKFLPQIYSPTRHQAPGLCAAPSPALYECVEAYSPPLKGGLYSPEGIHLPIRSKTAAASHQNDSGLSLRGGQSEIPIRSKRLEKGWNKFGKAIASILRRSPRATSKVSYTTAESTDDVSQSSFEQVVAPPDGFFGRHPRLHLRSVQLWMEHIRQLADLPPEHREPDTRFLSRSLATLERLPCYLFEEHVIPNALSEEALPLYHVPEIPASYCYGPDGEIIGGKNSAYREFRPASKSDVKRLWRQEFLFAPKMAQFRHWPLLLKESRLRLDNWRRYHKGGRSVRWRTRASNEVHVNASSVFTWYDSRLRRCHSE